MYYRKLYKITPHQYNDYHVRDIYLLFGSIKSTASYDQVPNTCGLKLVGKGKVEISSFKNKPFFSKAHPFLATMLLDEIDYNYLKTNNRFIHLWIKTSTNT